MLCLYPYKDKINSLNFYLRFLIFLPDQHQSMPHRQQQIFYPDIGLHQLIKFQYPACLRIAGIFFRDLTVPQHIVSHNDTSRPHLIEYQPVIRCILPFIGIDEYQIEAFIQPGYYLTGISDMKTICPASPLRSI